MAADQAGRSMSGEYASAAVSVHGGSGRVTFVSRAPCRAWTGDYTTKVRPSAAHPQARRLAARQSGSSAADIRGEVEQLITRRNIVTAAAIRNELAEDLTARTFATGAPLLDRDGVPDHHPSTRLAARARRRSRPHRTARRTRKHTGEYTEPVADGGVAFLDATQRDVVAAVASNHQLVVVEGAAGAGKTTTLTAARARSSGPMAD
jgi:hypothetical protein